MNKVSVVFLTEAGATSGMGHVRRTLVLAQAFCDEGAVCSFGIASKEGRKYTGSFPSNSIAKAVGNGGDILIVDGYNFGEADLKTWSGRFKLTVIIDDLGDKPLPCDIVINHNIYGHNVDYSAYSAPIVLAGSKYALIDPKFFMLRTRPKNAAPRTLIAFGGGDTATYGLTAARGLAAISDVPIGVAMGTSTQTLECANVTLHHKADMVELMAHSSVYFGALGVSFIEALAAGLPAVGVMVSENQRLAAKAAMQLGVPVFTLSEMELAIRTTAKISSIGPQPLALSQIDGLGASRIVGQLLARLGGNESFR